MKILGLITGVAMLLGAPSAYAATVAITNGDFESPITSSSSFDTFEAGSSSLTGWTIGGAGVNLIRGYWTSQHGAQSLDLNDDDIGSISQDLNDLTVGQQYTVTFYGAANPNAGPDEKQLQVSAAGITSAFSYFSAGHDNDHLGWAVTAFIFVARNTTETLTFAGLTGGPAGVALDNISIAATPIPGAILLFGSALGGLGFLGYRRKKLTAEA
jgi:choice-of-anchor C domain-containing protein